MRWDRDGIGIGIKLGDSGADVLYSAVGVDVGRDGIIASERMWCGLC